MTQQNTPTQESTREECVLTKPVGSDQRKTTDTGAPIGEGSYEGTERYAKSIGSYLETADVTADAKAAAPKSPEEARELRQAEAEGARRGREDGE